MIKILALDTPQWITNGDDLPSLYDNNHEKQLVSFVENNLYDGTDWVGALNSQPEYEMQWTDYTHRSFVFTTPDPSLNYFVSLEANQYYFWRVESRVKLNYDQVQFYVVMDIWMSFWPRITPLPNKQVLVHRAHSNRFYMLEPDAYYPSLVHLTDPIINPEADKPSKYPQTPKIWNPYELSDTNMQRFKFFYSNDSDPNPEIGTHPLPTFNPTFTYAVLVGSTNTDTPNQNGIFTQVGKFQYPFVYILLPYLGGFGVPANFTLPNNIRDAYQNIVDHYNSIIQSPYLIGAMTVNLIPPPDDSSGSQYFDDNWFSANIEFIDFKIDGTNPINIPILHRRNALARFSTIPIPIKLKTSFEIQNLYLDNPPIPSEPYSLSKESKLYTSPMYDISFEAYGFQNHHTFIPEYLLNEVKQTPTTSDFFWYFPTMVHNGAYHSFFTTSGLYSKYAFNADNDLPSLQTPSWVIDFSMFPTIQGTSMVPNLGSPYINYMATTQNTVQALYNVQKVNLAFAGASLGASAIGGASTALMGGGAMGLVMGGMSGANHLLNAARGAINYGITTRAHLADLKNSPESVNNLPTDFLMKSSFTAWGFLENKVNTIDANHFANRWHMIGYIWERLYSPTNQLFSGRYWFNYVRCSGFQQAFDHTNIPNEIIEWFGQKYHEGIRLWHSRIPTDVTVFNDFSKDNTEMFYDRTVWDF